MKDRFRVLESNLSAILAELRAQPEMASHYPDHQLSYTADMAQLEEFIRVGEFGLAYESIVADLESAPFRLSGVAAVKLLEVGLLMGFKTDRPQDSAFDRRTLVG